MTFLLLSVIFMWAANPVATRASEQAFIFSTFRDVYPESLEILRSPDGITFTTISATPTVYTPASGIDGVRDPSIALINNAYYIAHTAGQFGYANYFSIIRSTNLKDWAPVTTVSLASIQATVVWAPEFFSDDDGSVTIFVAVTTASSGGAFAIYALQATNSALTSWSAPTLVSGLPTRSAIDAQCVKVAGTYYMTYRHYTNGPDDFIEIATSNQRTGGYTVIKAGDFAGWGGVPTGSFREGPYLLHLGPGRWRMYSDGASNERWSDSNDDMVTWTPLSLVVTPVSVRHGTVKILPVYTPIESWRVENFGAPGDAGNGANGFDFDGDGIPNLMEYALGADPKFAGAAELPRFTLAGGVCTLRYRKVLAATDITYTVESCEVLNSPWTVSGISEANVPGTDDGVSRQIEATLNAGGAETKFMRLKVTQP